jgi:hypothetical protein
VRIARQTDEMSVRKKHRLPKACVSAAYDQVKINRYKTGKVFD